MVLEQSSGSFLRYVKSKPQLHTEEPDPQIPKDIYSHLAKTILFLMSLGIGSIGQAGQGGIAMLWCRCADCGIAAPRLNCVSSCPLSLLCFPVLREMYRHLGGR